MKTSTLALTVLLSLSMGCKGSDDAPASDPAPNAAVTPQADASPAAAPEAPAPSPGALPLVEPAGLSKADPRVAAWLRKAAKCDLHLEAPESDLSIVEQTWGDRWNWDDCAAKDDFADVDLDMEPPALDAALLDALGDEDRNLRFLAVYHLAGGYAENGRADALGKLLSAARDEKDPHVGAQIALVIDNELSRFGRIDDPAKGAPFVLALSDVLAQTGNQGLVAETGFSCKLPGCDTLWSKASRDNPSAAIRTLSHEMARDALDKEKGCSLSTELMSKDDDPLVLRHTADWLTQCEDASGPLLARLDGLGISKPGAAYLWNALDAIGTDDPKVEAKLSAWAKTIVDEKLGDDEIRGNAEALLSL